MKPKIELNKSDVFVILDHVPWTVSGFSVKGCPGCKVLVKELETIWNLLSEAYKEQEDDAK